MKNVMIILSELAVLIMMIVKPSIALEGARCGLTLWACTVLPGIFPASLLGSLLLRRINVPDKLEKMYIIIFGMLTGFPCAAILFSHYAVRHPHDKSMSAALAYCNISSPSFLLNYIYGFEVMQRIPMWVLLVTVYGSSLAGLGGVFILRKSKVRSYKNTRIKSYIKYIFKVLIPRIFYLAYSWIKRKKPKNERNYVKTVRNKHTNNIKSSFSKEIPSTAIMESCCLSMIKTCGYIILFAALSEYLMYFSEKLFTMSAKLFTISVNPFIRNTLTGIFCGLLEITTGINVLCSQTDLDNKYSSDSSSAFLSSQVMLPYERILQDIMLQDSFIVLGVLLINSLGGLSTLFQTISAAGDAFNIKKYIHHKLIYCMITACVYVVCSHIIC